MGRVNLQSALSSLITFFQNISISLDININLPESLKRFLTFFKNSFSIVLDFLPGFSDFDVRSKLTFISVFCVLLLDVLFSWFVLSFWRIFFHILDMVMSCALGFSIVNLYFKGLVKNPFFIVVIVVAVYFFFRIVHYYKKGKKDRDSRLTTNDYQATVQEVCAFFDPQAYIATLCDSCKHKTAYETLYSKNPEPFHFDNRRTLTDSCQKRLSKMIPGLYNQSELSTCQKVKTSLLLIFGLLIFVISILMMDLFPELSEYIDKIPLLIRNVVPIIGILVGPILFVKSALMFSEGGRNALSKLIFFIRRVGVKGLLFCLDVAYIPILSLFSQNILFKDSSSPCGIDNYLNYSLNTDDFLDVFKTHSSTCVECKNASSKYCASICNQIIDKVGYYEEDIRYVEDLIYSSVVTIIFIFLCILVGIPVLFRALTVKNYKLIQYTLPVYGKDNEKKWENAIERLKTTGIFIFSPYKMRYVHWAVVLLLMKIATLVIQTASMFVTHVSIGLPIMYGLMTIATIAFRPYIHTFNSVVDIMLYGGNTIISSVTVAAAYGHSVNNTVLIYISFISSSISVLATGLGLLYLVCKKADKDETYIDRARKKQIKERTDHELDEYVSSKNILTHYPESKLFSWYLNNEELLDVYVTKVMALNTSTIKSKLDEKNDITDSGIHPDPSKTELNAAKDKLIQNPSHVADFSGNTENLAKTDKKTKETGLEDRVIDFIALSYYKMYYIFDLVIDNHVLQTTTNYLSFIVYMATFNMGFYTSFMMIQYENYGLEC